MTAIGIASPSFSPRTPSPQSSNPAPKDVATALDSPSQGLSTSQSTASRKRRPCDACRRRKSKCVVVTAQHRCNACLAHEFECTYIEQPASRKRKSGLELGRARISKRRYLFPVQLVRSKHLSKRFTDSGLLVSLVFTLILLDLPK